MSFDLAIWSDVTRSTKQAAQIYLRLRENEDASLLRPYPQAADNIADFVQELTQRYPAIETFSDDTVDDCIWSFEFVISDAYVLLDIRYSFVDEVLPFVGQLSYKHNLTCYDPQKQTILLPKKRH